jgi:hypothetical protein
MSLDTPAIATHIAVSETVARLAHMLGLLEAGNGGGYVISDKGLQALLDYAQAVDLP